MKKHAKKIMSALMVTVGCFSLASCKNQNDYELPVLNSDVLRMLPDDFNDEIIVEGDIVDSIREVGCQCYSFDLMNIDFIEENSKYYVLLNGEMTTAFESGRQDGLVIFEISQKSYISYKDRLRVNRMYFGNEYNSEIITNESYACLKYDIYLLGKLLREDDTSLSYVKNLETENVIYDSRRMNNKHLFEL